MVQLIDGMNESKELYKLQFCSSTVGGGSLENLCYAMMFFFFFFFPIYCPCWAFIQEQRNIE